MANNIVSRWLHDVPKQDALDATNYEKAARIRDYATNLDRLVDAVAYELKANEIHIYKDGRHTIEYRSTNQYDLAAALAAIKLPEQNEQ